MVLFRNIILVGLTSLLTDVSSEMVYPLIPLFLTSTIGAAPTIVGLIEGIAESLASLLKVFSGYVSDRVGRRKHLAIVGYALSVGGKLLLAVAGSWGVVLAARGVDRFGKGIRTAPRDALIAESVDSARRGWAFGLHRAMDTAGAAIGVLLALYFMVQYGGEYNRVFLWSMLPAALGVTLLFWIREVAPKELAKRSPPVLRWSILPSRLKAFLVIAFMFALGNSSNTFLLLRAQNLGFTPVSVVLLYLVYNVTYALGSYPAGKLSDRVGRKPLLVAGYAVYGIVYLGFALVSGTDASWQVWTLFALYGLYSAFTEGVEKAFVADLAPADTRATALGLHATGVGIGLLPASLLAGYLWTLLGPNAPFVFGGAMALAAAVALRILL
jgi:MFS family permease